MNAYITETIAHQRIDEAARYAESAHIRREAGRTSSRWHFPRVNWHFPVPTRVAGV